MINYIYVGNVPKYSMIPCFLYVNIPLYDYHRNPVFKLAVQVLYLTVIWPRILGMDGRWNLDLPTFSFHSVKSILLFFLGTKGFLPPLSFKHSEISGGGAFTGTHMLSDTLLLSVGRNWDAVFLVHMAETKSLCTVTYSYDIWTLTAFFMKKIHLHFYLEWLSLPLYELPHTKLA